MTVRRTSMLIAALALTMALTPAMPAGAFQELSTQDLSEGTTPEEMVDELVGAGVTSSNVTYAGAQVAGGRFSGGGEGPDAIIGFDQGIILSSGDIAHVIGPNEQDGITGENGTPGDPDLTELAGFPTFDASVLEFDFVPDADTISFQYVFASDEYNEFVNSSFNDVFAFFVNGTNCATVNEQPVSINTINNGNPFGTDPRSNPHLYRNNDLDDGGGDIDTEMDGLTVVLTCEASVTPNATNHIKLAIADASDSSLDSNVFLKAGSFATVSADLAISKTDDPDPVQAGETVRYRLSVTNHGPEDSGATVTDTISAGTILSAEGTGWSCGHEATTASCTLDAPLASGATAEPIDIMVRAPGEAGSITNTATVTGTVQDPDLENNEAVEQTTVAAPSEPTRDEVEVFCPPEGCSFRTGDEPTEDDPTVNHVVVPPGGDGSITRIVEGPTTFPCGPGSTVGDQSRGQETDFLPPTGLDDPANPIRVTTIWHSSVWPETDTKVRICMRKERPAPKGQTRVQLFTVSRCRTPGIAKPGPCIEDASRDANGNMQVRFLMLSPDPQWRR